MEVIKVDVVLIFYRLPGLFGGKSELVVVCCGEGLVPAPGKPWMREAHTIRRTLLGHVNKLCRQSVVSAKTTKSTG